MRILSERLSTTSRMYWVALGLTGLLVAYMGIWFSRIVLALFTDSPSRVFGISVREALTYTKGVDIVLFFCTTASFGAAFALLAWRRAASVVALGAGILLHLAVWISLTANPIYDSSIGLLVISIEVIILLLVLRLRQVSGRS